MDKTQPQAPHHKRKPLKLHTAGESDPITYYRISDQDQMALFDLCEQMRLLSALSAPRTWGEDRDLALPMAPLCECFTQAFMRLKDVLHHLKPLTEAQENPVGA